MDEKVDKYGNVYLKYHREEFMDGSDIINNILLSKMRAIFDQKEIKDIYMTHVIDGDKNIDYSLLENRKNSKNIIKIDDKKIIENNKYRFPIVYIICDNNHIAVNDNDFVLPPEEKEFMDKGEIG
jgi:hypothetical protein